MINKLDSEDNFNKGIIQYKANNLFELFQFLYKIVSSKIVWISAFSIGIGLVGVYLATVSKPKYLATLTCVFKEDTQASLLSGLSGLSAMIGTGTNPTVIDPLERFVELGMSNQILSRTLLKTVIISNTKDLLINHYIRIHELESKWQKINSGPDSVLRNVHYNFDTKYLNINAIQRRGLQYVIKNIKSKLTIFFDKKSGVIEIQFKDLNEEQASILVYSLYEHLVDFYTKQATTALKNRVYILQEKVDSIQRALSITQSANASSFDQGLGIILQKDKVRQRRLGFQENTLSLMYGEALKSLEQLNFLLTTTSPSFTVIDEPFLPLKYEKKSRLIYGLLFFSVAFITVSLYFIVVFVYKNKVHLTP